MTETTIKTTKTQRAARDKAPAPDQPLWPKGDLRRMLSVLVAIDRRQGSGGQGGATLLELSQDTGLDKRSITHQIQAACAQAGVTLAKSGSRWRISSWGTLINRDGVHQLFPPKS